MKNQLNYKQRNELVISLTLYCLISFLGAWRVFAMLKGMMLTVKSGIYAAIYFLFCTALPLGFLLPNSTASKWLDIIGNYWLCFQLTFFFAALVEWPINVLAVDLFHLLTRPQYSFFALILFAATTLITIYGIANARVIRLTQYECQVQKPALQGEKPRIVHLSDLHLGAVNNLKAMKKIVKRVNALRPHVVCITGDTFTESVRNVFELEEISAAFRAITSKYGVYACLGNHDSGNELPQMLDFFRKSKIRVLVDEWAEVGSLILLGRSDMGPVGAAKLQRKPVADCLKGADTGKAIVVMDHQPGDIEEARAAGADLLLSGHTHGGQFFPVHRIVRRVFPHYYGYKKYGAMHAVVSSGTFTATPPVRIGSHSEIVEIALFC